MVTAFARCGAKNAISKKNNGKVRFTMSQIYEQIPAKVFSAADRGNDRGQLRG